MERKPSSKENSMHYLLQVAKDPGIKKYMYEFIGKESEWIRFLAVSFTSRKSIALFPIRIVLTFSSSFFLYTSLKSIATIQRDFFPLLLFPIVECITVPKQELMKEIKRKTHPSEGSFICFYLIFNKE